MMCSSSYVRVVKRTLWSHYRLHLYRQFVRSLSYDGRDSIHILPFSYCICINWELFAATTAAFPWKLLVLLWNGAWLKSSERCATIWFSDGILYEVYHTERNWVLFFGFDHFVVNEDERCVYSYCPSWLESTSSGECLVQNLSRLGLMLEGQIFFNLAQMVKLRQ